MILSDRPAKNRTIQGESLFSSGLKLKGRSSNEVGLWVLFTKITDIVQTLQVARRELQLGAAIAKLDKFDLIILDDLACVTKDQA